MVELPKEKPEEPLELFSNVPNLQIVVMGGDGTAGWILSCLDAMQEKRALLPDPQIWSPPPVAIIPLGTGTSVAHYLQGLSLIFKRSCIIPFQQNLCVFLLHWPINFSFASLMRKKNLSEYITVVELGCRLLQRYDLSYLFDCAPTRVIAPVADLCGRARKGKDTT